MEPHHSYFTARTTGECLYLGWQCADIAVHTFTLTTHVLDFWGNQQKIGVRESLIERIWLNIARIVGSAVAELLLSSWRCITLRHNCRSLKLHIHCRLQLLLTTTRTEKTETALHRWNTEFAEILIYPSKLECLKWCLGCIAYSYGVKKAQQCTYCNPKTCDNGAISGEGSLTLNYAWAVGGNLIWLLILIIVTVGHINPLCSFIFRECYRGLGLGSQTAPQAIPYKILHLSKIYLYDLAICP